MLQGITLDARTAALIVHIVAGTIALLAGIVALLAVKGGRLHRLGGRGYVVAMVGLLATGAALALARFDPFVAINAVFALYLVATSWWTLRQSPPAAALLPLVALGCGLIDIAVGIHALSEPHARFAGYPAGGYFAFAIFALAAATGDVFCASRTYRRSAMLARHAWRMCVPLSMAAGSLFLGQQQVLPHVLRGSPLMILLSIAPFVPMLWWLVRLGRTAPIVQTR